MQVRRSTQRLPSAFKRLFPAKGVVPAHVPTKIWREWSIGIYAGDSPLRLKPAAGVRNPVLTAAQVTDVSARFVADPFMVAVGQRWHMFFEVWNRESDKGEIGLAVSDDAKSWVYQRIVLAEPFHLSYPYVFQWQGTYYIVPETRRANSVRLYKALHFPDEWRFERTLLENCDLGDSSLFYAGNRWWLFSGTGVPPYRADTLRLFHAEDLQGSWREHPKSPLIRGNVHIARPGGRVLVQGERIVRFAQDCDGGYGLRVRALEVAELTPRRYRERELSASPILEGSGTGWNLTGMHHVDASPVGGGRWIACVDGQIAHERDGAPS